MSRSYRKPYASITGNRSAHDDKQHAARGVRRAQDRAIKTFDGEDWDDLVIPVRFECSWNEVYCWSRDGHQHLQYPPSLKWRWLSYRWNGLRYSEEKIAKNFADALKRYEKLKRK